MSRTGQHWKASDLVGKITKNNNKYVHLEWSAPAGRKKVGLSSNVGFSYVRFSDSNLHRVHQAWLVTVVAAPSLKMRVHVNTRKTVIVAKLHTST